MPPRQDEGPQAQAEAAAERGEQAHEEDLDSGCTARSPKLAAPAEPDGKGGVGNSQAAIPWTETLRSAWSVAGIFFRDVRWRWKARALTATMSLALVTETVVTSWLSQLAKQITTALVNRDDDAYRSSLLVTVFACALLLPLTFVSEWVSGALTIEWRKAITKQLFERYIDGSQVYYRLKFHDASIDNPDQRLGQDVGDFTTSVVKLLATVVGAAMKLVVMSGLLIAISPDLYAYTLVGSVAATVLFLKVFGGRLMRLNRRVLAAEATLRFALIRVREHAEAIAFYQGAAFELARCAQLFAGVTASCYRRLAVWVAFSGVQKALGTYAFLLPMLVLAPKILSGQLEFGVITQTNMLFGILLGSLTMLVNDLGTLAGLGAQAVRIEQLRSTVEDLSARKGGGVEGESCIQLTEQDAAGPYASLGDVLLCLSAVTLQPPRCEQPTVRELSLALRAGESMLVCGESGIGKSSLLRAVGGLWSRGSGSITRCPADRCFFVPQEPYLCLGSLRDNATYPGGLDGKQVSDAAVECALASANLSYLVSRHGLDAPVDFESVLSGGEKQRMSFARLLLRPRLQFAILDEATSALDAENEDRLYRLLADAVPSYASVGHRKNLEKFHSHKLVLERVPSGGCLGVLRRLGEGTE